MVWWCLILLCRLNETDGSLNLLQQEDYGAEILLGPDGHNVLPAVGGLALFWSTGWEEMIGWSRFRSFILGVPGPGILLYREI